MTQKFIGKNIHFLYTLHLFFCWTHLAEAGFLGKHVQDGQSDIQLKSPPFVFSLFALPRAETKWNTRKSLLSDLNSKRKVFLLLILLLFSVFLFLSSSSFVLEDLIKPGNGGCMTWMPKFNTICQPDIRCYVIL